MSMTFEEFFEVADSVKPESVELKSAPALGQITWSVEDGTSDELEITVLHYKEIMFGQPHLKTGSATGRWLFDDLAVVQWLGLIAGFLTEVED